MRRIWAAIAGLMIAYAAIPQSSPGGNAYVPTKIVAGTNVTISPTSGLGTVTINATGGGSGSVTSVAFADGSTTPIYTITGSPVTGTGTLTETLSTESANLIFAGPTTGSAAQPTFRSLVAADLPTISLTSGVSGTLQAAQFPALTGDVTNTAGSLSTTISAGAVTLAKQANLAANSIQGNNTGSPATPIALTVAQVQTLIAAANPSQPQILYQFGVPVIIPSSGSMANNGAITLTTALPAGLLTPGTFNCWLFLPANAIASGSTAGVYFTKMSSTTVGQVYNNVLSGAPTILASPTAFSTTGPGAYTQSTSIQSLVTLSIAAAAMGTNGAVRLSGTVLIPNNADVKTNTITFGGTAIMAVALASQYWGGFIRTIRNLGNANLQYSISSTSTTATSDQINNGTGSLTALAVNTANAANLVFEGTIGTATDYYILAGVTVELLYAA